MSTENVGPEGQRIVVVFNMCVEAWSEGKAPGINPMGNPLPPKTLDRMAISWAEYGVRAGVHRLLDSFARYDVRASVAVNGVIAERSPETVEAIARGGHELVGHSYAMDVVPALQSEEEERGNIEACTRLLAKASGAVVRGWLSPRATPSERTGRLLAAAGYTWYGDVLNDDVPYIQQFDNDRIVAIPFDTDVNDMPFMKFGAPPAAMLDSFAQNLEAAKRWSGTSIIDVTTHAHIFGRPRGALFHEKIIEAAAKDPEVWIATKAEIADTVLTRG